MHMHNSGENMINATMNFTEELLINTVFLVNPYSADNINRLEIPCKIRINTVIILFIFGLFVFNIILKYYIMEIKSSFI
ncbi:hypothetical protein [Borrelia sp. HM]|uniref:hypothetical protein n=1 Tax=Borrelia sp. HM TaxID=1882662 RepID=UPI001C74BF16|nr:hypothetical protein [Borrelia sp. HM]BCR21793.1 hypothetical protein BKFM_00359 [Borrelia sp. HM]